MTNKKFAFTIGAAMILGSSFGIAQELQPARPDVDEGAIDFAWTEAWDDHLHSGDRIPFTPPTVEDIPEGDFGELVRDGMQAFMFPAVYAREYVGNEMACTNCHLDAGRRAGAAPMWGAYPVYPKFRSKNQQVNTMEMRVQGCFRYSMNGTPPLQTVTSCRPTWRTFLGCHRARQLGQNWKALGSMLFLTRSKNLI